MSFAPTLSLVFDRCRQKMPPLIETHPITTAACWIDVITGKPRA
jgi:hypothetical protein